MIPKLKIRGCDEFGCGHFGAGRGKRKHNGVDLLLLHNQNARSLCDGKVTKIGYPYSDDLSYRYVEVKNENGDLWRHFYVSPSVRVGDEVKRYQVIGKAQDLSKRYTGIPNHIHFEIKRGSTYIDPTEEVENYNANI